jgi:hypothetical protein
MHGQRSLEISQHVVYLSLLQQEERRLHEVIASEFAAPEIRSQAQERLKAVLKDIAVEAEALRQLQSRSEPPSHAPKPVQK